MKHPVMLINVLSRIFNRHASIQMVMILNNNRKIIYVNQP